MQIHRNTDLVTQTAEQLFISDTYLSQKNVKWYLHLLKQQ